MSRGREDTPSRSKGPGVPTPRVKGNEHESRLRISSQTAGIATSRTRHSPGKTRTNEDTGTRLVIYETRASFLYGFSFLHDW